MCNTLAMGDDGEGEAMNFREYMQYEKSRNPQGMQHEYQYRGVDR
jgi:hypothetical protein